MLEMSRVFAILRADGPLVLGVHEDGFVSHSDHRLDGDEHAGFQHGSITASPIVGNRRVFVHLTADAMSGEFSDDAVAMRFAMTLHGAADVSDMLACDGILNAEIEAFLRCFQQLTNFVADFTDTKSIGRVTIKAVKESSTVNGDNVTLLKDGLSIGYSMNDDVVDRGTDAARKRTPIGIREILERGDSPMIANEFLGNGIQLQRRDARFNMFGQFAERFTNKLVRSAH